MLTQIEQIYSALVEPLLSKLAPELYPLYVRLNDVHAQLDGFRQSGAYSIDADVLPLQRALVAIENEHVRDGMWVATGVSATSTGSPVSITAGAGDASTVQPGQAILHAKLHDCHRIAHFLVAQLEAVGENLLPVYERLVDLHKRMLVCEGASMGLNMLCAPTSMRILHNRTAHADTDLSRMKSPTAVSVSQVTKIQRELRDIDSFRHHNGSQGYVSVAMSSYCIPARHKLHTHRTSHAHCTLRAFRTPHTTVPASFSTWTPKLPPGKHP